jgi:hypothetical protein
MKTHDLSGCIVNVGDQVKILTVRDSVLARLDSIDRDRVASIKGEVLAVYEIDEWGGAWVRREWDTGSGRWISHSLSLAPHEMQLAKQV